MRKHRKPKASAFEFGSDFVFTTNGSRTHFVPTSKSVRRTFAMLSFGVLFMLVGGFVMFYAYTNVNGHPSMFYPVAGIVMAAILATAGFWMWRVRSTPLIVDRATRAVLYGDKVICDAGTVKAVRLGCSQLEVEENNCWFNLVVDSGEFREIPSPWFSTMSAGSTVELAKMIATLLNVEVQYKAR